MKQRSLLEAITEARVQRPFLEAITEARVQRSLLETITEARLRLEAIMEARFLSSSSDPQDP
jgi:hypothetical protein